MNILRVECADAGKQKERGNQSHCPLSFVRSFLAEQPRLLACTR